MKKMMGWLAALLMISASTAQAGTLADQANRLAEKLAAVEQDLRRVDAEDIEYSLRNLQRLLDRYEDAQALRLTCVSNGESMAAFERFRLVDLRTGQRLGGETTAQTCQALLKSQENGLVCISNGETMAAFERFGIYDSKLSKRLGGFTSLENCQALVKKSTRELVCVSNGETMAAFERFRPTSRLTGQAIGGETQLSTCVNSLPRR